jgi:tellurite resistance protein
MTGYTDMQLNIWLRGLLAIAWADGDCTVDERTMIIDLTQTELPPGIDLRHLDPICIDELVASFGHCSHMAENFLRTAMMVALADGVYSSPEATLLRKFHQALNVDTQVLTALESTMLSANTVELGGTNIQKIDPLLAVREWLDGLELHDPRLAGLLCQVIPAQFFDSELELQ